VVSYLAGADIGKRVADFRRQRGLSARQLADRTELPGLTRVVITRLENGRRESVDVVELLCLANALDISPALLFPPLGQEIEARQQELGTCVEHLWSACQAVGHALGRQP